MALSERLADRPDATPYKEIWIYSPCPRRACTQGTRRVRERRPRAANATPSHDLGGCPGSSVGGGIVVAQGETFHRHIARRSLLKMGAAGAVAAQLGLLEHLARQPERVAAANAGPFPLIQFDIGSFVAPARTFNDGARAVLAQF